MHTSNTSLSVCLNLIPLTLLQDLRNHGTSPHAEPHTYAAMATDISHFLQKKGITQGVNLLGHSMCVGRRRVGPLTGSLTGWDALRGSSTVSL